MTKLKKADLIFKYVILGLVVISLLTLFLPIYEQTYTSTYEETTETTTFYFYGSSYFTYTTTITVMLYALLVPILSIVFLFMNFKKSRLLSYGLISVYVLDNIFSLLLIKNMIADNTNERYTYTLKYGYSIFVAELVLLCAVVITSLVLYLIDSLCDKKARLRENNQDLSNPTQIDLLKSRIETLNELKDSGIITEEEYEQKRSEIVKNIRI